MLKGFKNFLMRGDLIVVAVGLVVALAFSTLISAFTTNIVTPLINGIAGNPTKPGLAWTVNGQLVILGEKTVELCVAEPPEMPRI